MKTKVIENKFGLSIYIEPETLAEANQLLRFTNNARQEKPSIRLYFSGDNPEMLVWMRKVKEANQSNSIQPKGQRR